MGLKSKKIKENTGDAKPLPVKSGETYNRKTAPFGDKPTDHEWLGQAHQVYR